MNKIACPVCLGENFKHFCQKDDMEVVICQKCQLIFTNPQLNRTEIREHYDKNYYYSPKKEKTDRSRYFDYNKNYLEGDGLKRFKIIFERLENIKPAKGRILDVGAATGFFVKEASNRGWNAEGIEISHWAVDYARKSLHQKMHCGDLASLGHEKSAFDVIVMNDVLEHVENPLKEVKLAAKLLKKDGLLFIETINFDNFITRNIIGKNYVHMVPKFHLFYFGRHQLRDILAKAGFEILEETLWSSSVGDYKETGWKMYWRYFLLLFSQKLPENLAVNDVIKIYAKKC